MKILKLIFNLGTNKTHIFGTFFVLVLLVALLDL
jgi:hypothetical protein